MQITVKGDISRAAKLPAAINRQFRYAAPFALNDTAFKGKQALMKHAKLVFKNTNHRTETLGTIEKAKRGKLQARLYLREDMKTGIQPGKYLRAEIDGGPRRDKRLERALQQTFFYTKKLGSRKVLPDGWLAVPHPSITNKNDNLTAPRSRAIIADMKKNGGRNGSKYFLIHPDSARPSGILPGIYYRSSKRKIKLAVMYVDKSSISYSKKFKFYKVARAAYDRWFPIYMRKSFEKALKTMKV